MIYNEFKSVIVQRLCAEKLLPIEPEVLKGPEAQKGKEATGEVDAWWITSTSSRRRNYSNTSFYDTSTRKCFGFSWNPSAAEHGARMAAMDSATNNAADLIDDLTLANEQNSPGGHHAGN